ncbi:MAG: efflux transporter outer membrane subunit, partial [Caulobacter sp.]
TLRGLIETALANNRDLRETVANVAAARAQYRGQRSSQAPTLNLTADGSKTGASDAAGGDSASYSAGLGISSFELDLFGRLRSLSRQALETYLSTEAGMRSAKLSLVAETANAYVTLAADQGLLDAARETLASGEKTLSLTRALQAAGLAGQGDVQDALTIVAQARADIESYVTAVAQARNALDLLVGAPTGDGASTLVDLDAALGKPPAGLSSSVLKKRPDVLEAEHTLRAKEQAIGAARAAYFPTISLTASTGVASTALKELFGSGSGQWNLAPSVSLPLLGGSRRADLDAAKADRDAALASYEGAVQTAFKEVADGLARRGSIDRQRLAQADLVSAADKSRVLARAKYEAGADTFLNALTAQRTYYAARQAEISVVQEDLANRITLYQVLGADGSL